LLLIGADQVLDGRHFDATTHTPEEIGRKAMNRNLSDCAAMAALPFCAVVTMALPRTIPLDYAKRLFSGLKAAADEFGCSVVGGDTGTWNGRLALSVAIVGRSAGIDPIRRNGAQADDGLYVTGGLGGSILGRHLTFTPRVDLARRLASNYRITSMIDLSDGLSRDLNHLCQESAVGVIVDAAALPIHPDVARLPHGERSTLDHALHDGEDYELLFTSASQIPADLATRIGTMTHDRQMLLRMDGQLVPIPPGGWEHQLGMNP
jgi:thiamine-monophosphate kinase